MPRPGQAQLPKFPLPRNGRSSPTKPAGCRAAFLPSRCPGPRVTKADPVATSPPPHIGARSAPSWFGLAFEAGPEHAPWGSTLCPHSGPALGARSATPLKSPNYAFFLMPPAVVSDIRQPLISWPPWPLEGPRGPPRTPSPLGCCRARMEDAGYSQSSHLRPNFFPILLILTMGVSPIFLRMSGKILGDFVL